MPMSEELRSVLDRFADSNWRTRLSALDALLALASRDSDAVRRDATAAVDEVARRVGDGNLKVAAAAVEAVRKLIDSPALHGDALESAVPVLLPPLAVASANRNKAVAAGSLDIIDRVLAKADSRHTLAPLVSAISNGNSTVRGALLPRLESLVPAAHKSRPGILQRAVLPRLFPLLDDTRLETRSGAAATVAAVARAIGADGVRKVASASGGAFSSAVEGAIADIE